MGTVIFLLMTGTYPFEGKNPIQVMQSITKGVYTFPSDIKISNVCLSIIHHLLQVAPDSRYGYDEYLAHPFVSTPPNDYLAELRKLFGPMYGLADPLSVHEEPPPPPPTHYEKSEMIPPPMLKKPSDTFMSNSANHMRAI